MLEQSLRLLVVASVALLILPGCSSMTKSGRDQARYAKYVRKHSGKRVAQKKKFKRIKMPLTPESKSVVHSGATDAPQSAASNSGE